MLLDSLCSKMSEHMLYSDTSSHPIFVDICESYSNLLISQANLTEKKKKEHQEEIAEMRNENQQLQA